MSFHLVYHGTFRGTSKSWPDTQNLPKESKMTLEQQETSPSRSINKPSIDFLSTRDSERNLSRKKTSRIMNKLSTKTLVLLSELVRNEYPERKQTDADFATYASEKLGTKITSGNVSGMRDTFGIPSSREVAALANPDMLVKRVEELERLVAKLQSDIQTTLG